MRVTKVAVIQAASDIVDENGLNSVSLKSVAEKLNIRTPSLYNHIASLDDLLREVAHKGMRTMNEKMAQVAIGNSGDTAIQAVSVEYLNFMIEHPGIYETIQWATWHGTNDTAEIWGNYTSLLTKLILSCQLKTERTDEILNLLTGVLHGYTTLQLRFALTEPNKARECLSNAIDTVLMGIHQKYHL
jgi:AcrR family transcriptional regulator